MDHEVNSFDDGEYGCMQNHMANIGAGVYVSVDRWYRALMAGTGRINHSVVFGSFKDAAPCTPS